MHPEQHYIQDYIDLYEHIGDPAYLAKEEAFNSWYENPIDLPGRWYLQVITQLFKENRLAKGTFVGLGRRLDFNSINVPSISLPARLTTSRRPSRSSCQKLCWYAYGAHCRKNRARRPYRPFHGARTLKEDWPEIAGWIAAQSA